LFIQGLSGIESATKGLPTGTSSGHWPVSTSELGLTKNKDFFPTQFEVS
jgi:hypothetical protein